MKKMLDELHKLVAGIARPLKLMEVCGTHTVEIFRHGIRDVIPRTVTLLSGPGCPVCVTSVQDVDAAIAIAKAPGVIMATFGDMMRVPGGKESLLEARSEGADVRVLYSPLDALSLARKETNKEIVFFATALRPPLRLSPPRLRRQPQKESRTSPCILRTSLCLRHCRLSSILRMSWLMVSSCRDMSARSSGTNHMNSSLPATASRR